MSLLSRALGKRRTALTAGTVTVASAALVALAVMYDGEATADVDLNDSGVWVTKTASGLVGRFNTESQALDGTLLAGSAAFDVAQNAGRVLLDDDGTSAASAIDPARLKLASQTKVPGGAQVALGGDTVAILDGDAGLLWVLPFAQLPGFDPEKTEPAAETGAGGAVAVSQTGTAFAVIPSADTLWTATPGEGEEPAQATSTTLDLADGGDDVTVTAVGDEAVVLNRTDGHLRLPGGAVVDVDDAQQARLQQPGPDTGRVVLATTSSLVSQPLGGGDGETRRASGVPAAPVQLGGCTYAAWSSSGQVIRNCDGTDRDVDTTLEGISPQTRLEYRVNRQAVVLNDLASGTLWMALDEYEKVDDWDVTLPEQAEGEDEDAEKSTPEQVDNTVVDRENPNSPPVPTDDDFGVRPGRTTVLPVLANDVDPDGDVITAALAGDSPEQGQIQQVLGGAALQAVVPEDATGTGEFRYDVSDGRGGVAQGSVRMRVVPLTENEPPVQTGSPVLRLEQGTTSQIKVLPFFRDPDGDDLYLASADVTVNGDEVRSQPDGTVEFRDGGGSTGRKKVTLTVVDSLGEAVEGELLIDVLGDGQEPPVAVGDHVVVQAGEPVTVEPLRNDSDPNGDELRLASVTEAAPAEITPNYDAGTFTFLSMEPRSYDVLYQVTDGPNATTGVVRVDVQAPSDDSGAPIVVSDTALLPAGGSTLVDVLANDTDPAGGVLVVQSVSVPQDAGVSVAVLAHQMLRVTESRTLSGPVVVQYTVSNGTQSATGQVRVIPVPAPVRLQPPSANPDEVTVYAGDVVNIPVLANDTHPDGLELFLQDELEQDVDPAQGQAFVSEDRLRFRAGDEAGTAYAIYTVRDRNGQEDSAQVTIHIRDGEDNTAPVPRDVEARVLSGATVRIAIPLDGIDPDGDSVQLTGVASSPAKGRVEVVDGYVDYRAADSARGADSFRYTVQDARGAVATGVVRVGIAEPPATNQAPVGVDDEVTVRPGRTVAVAPLLNDSDPDGDPVGLVGGALEGAEELDAQVVDDRVVLTSPADDGTYTFYYALEDPYGARGSAAITVNVAADAPLLRPVARDDTVQVAQVLGQTSVDVPVLDNDEDPDGAASELVVSSEDTTATPQADGTLRIALTDERQVVTYTVTDVDGLTATAFVRVPGAADQVPVLKPGQAPLEVVSGEPLTVDITDHVLVMEGRTPRLTTEDQVTALEGSVVVADATTMTYTSAEGYTGEAGLTFEVTDGSGPDDPEGHSAVLTLPITVLPPENLAPEAGAPTGQVAAGEESSVDLGRFATDPDGDSLRFALGGVPAGLTATLSGSTVALQAEPDVAKGTTVTIPFTVTDEQHPPVEGSIAVQVVASTRPLAKAVPDTVEKTHQGEPVTIPVTDNDANPFPETPLEVIAAFTETGSAASTTYDKGSVTVTPSETYVGTLVVVYRIQDATKDPDRLVEGRVTLNVQGIPEAPAKPQVEEIRSETVVLSWTPPVNNGAEITGYTVTSNNGYTKECATTTCTLDGLTNNVTYTFTVVATNEVGDSKPSVASEEARPDEKPDPPTAPELKFGDESLEITWVNATYSDRSPIENVNLEISPAPASGATQKVGVTGNRIVWEGLTNGTAYKVRVQAVNLAPDPSDWGAWSTTEIPARAPEVPAAPNASRATTSVNGGVIGVTWTPPANNGDAVSTYYLQVLKEGAVVASDQTAGTSFSFTGLDPAASYTFTVDAENKAGRSGYSAPSNAVIPYGKPDTPAKPTAALISGDTNGKARVTWGYSGDARGPGLYYKVRADGAGERQATSPYTYTGLSNGSGHTFQVAACNSFACSDWSAASNSVTPYTVPGQASATVSKTSPTTLRFTAHAPGSNGGSAITRYEWSDGSTGGTTDAGNGYGQTHSRWVKACNAAGCGPQSPTVSGTTDPPPPPPQATVSMGPVRQVAGCDTTNCHQFRVSTNSTFPGGSHRISCWSNYQNYDHNITGNTYTVNLGPNSTIDLSCVLGITHGAQVWVVIDGHTNYSVRSTWPQ